MTLFPNPAVCPLCVLYVHPAIKTAAITQIPKIAYFFIFPSPREIIVYLRLSSHVLPFYQVCLQNHRYSTFPLPISVQRRVSYLCGVYTMGRTWTLHSSSPAFPSRSSGHLFINEII